MRLSHAKINHMANLLIDYRRNDSSVEFFQDDSDIRMEMVRIINEELKDDEIIDAEARRKIESQRRDIQTVDFTHADDRTGRHP